MTNDKVVVVFTRHICAWLLHGGANRKTIQPYQWKHRRLWIASVEKNSSCAACDQDLLVYEMGQSVNTG